MDFISGYSNFKSFTLQVKNKKLRPQAYALDLKNVY